jgi:hypothetical protein
LTARAATAAASTAPAPASAAPAFIHAQAEAERTPDQTAQWLALLSGHGIHPQLAVSHPDDPDEREADALADRVLGMTAPSGDPLAVGGVGAALSRACCAQCDDEEEGPRVSRRAERAVIAGPASARTAARAVAEGGEPLAAAERAYFEPRFGHDLSGVRIHTHGAAARAAQGIGALAYTHGQDIAFASGQFRPDTAGGRRLLAHELAHTLQHSGGAPLLDRQTSTEGAVTIRRRAVDKIYRQCPPPIMNRGAAGGCGLCMGGNAADIGSEVHRQAQYRFFSSDPSLIQDNARMERIIESAPGGSTPRSGLPRLDLSRVVEESDLTIIEIGEIKPFDDAGIQHQEALKDLAFYYERLEASGEFDMIRLLTEPPPPPFPFLEPTRPPRCPIQTLHICRTDAGVYQYYCSPSWAEAQRNPDCQCGRRRERRRERQRQRDRVRDPIDVPITPPVTVPDAPGVPVGERPPVGEPVRVPEGPVTLPEGPVTVPEGPVTVPEGPVSVPEGPVVTVPEEPIVTVPEGPVSAPDGLPGLGGEPANDNSYPEAANHDTEVDGEEAQQAARVAAAAAAAAVVLWAIKQLPQGALRRVLGPLQAAAMVAVVVFYSNVVHAEVGPGESPLESLFEAMQQDGIPVDDELRARIEADPALRQALEGAARSGDMTEAQRAIAQRTMELVAENPDAFSDEDLRIMAETMESASNSDPATQPTVESLRRAIEARRRGEPIGPIIDQALEDARNGVSRAPDAAPPAADASIDTSTPDTPPPAETPVEPLPIPEEYRQQLAASPERERLFREMVGDQAGLRLTNAMIERFLATVPADVTADQVTVLIDRVVSAEGATEDEVFARLERAVAEVRNAPKTEAGDPGETADPQVPDAGATGPAIEMEGETIEAPAPTGDATAQPSAPVPATPAKAAPSATPSRGGLTPDQLARLRRFIASSPRPGMVNPLPPASERVPGRRFTRLVAMPDGSGLVAAFMTMQITAVRRPNDFDVVLFPATFYRADGRRRGVFPQRATTTPIGGID